MIDKIRFGTTDINYSVLFSKRKTLVITVNPDGTVLLKAPFDSTRQQLEEKLIKRASWVLKQQRYFTSFGERSPEKRFISGESHYYLGRQYMLKIEEGKPDSAKYKGRYFEVICTPRSKAKDLMNIWYKDRAKVKFIEILQPLASRFSKYNVEPSSVFIREMKGRWGSCTPNGKIILNTELIKAPKPCIEYVIIHELCHLVHRGHTKAFFDLLEKEMPDWKRWKERLEQFMF